MSLRGRGNPSPLFSLIKICFNKIMDTRQPKFQFILDHQYDARMIYVMLSPGDPAGRASRAASMGIDETTAERIGKGKWEDVKKEVNVLVRQRYQLVEKYLRVTHRLYQDSWNDINDIFFRFVAQKTKWGWENKNYQCVVSAFHRGISNWHGNTIARIWTENHFIMRKFTAHELIICHIFSIFRRDQKLNNTLSDQQIWKIAEVAAWSMTGFESQLLRLWPWLLPQQRFPVNHNYPNLVPLQLKLGEIYKKSKTFDRFLSRSIAIVSQKKV